MALSPSVNRAMPLSASESFFEPWPGVSHEVPAALSPREAMDLAATGSQAEYGWRSSNSGDLLSEYRSEIAMLTHCARHVDTATFYMCAAFEGANVRDFEDNNFNAPGGRINTWLGHLAETTFDRFRTLRRALKHEWRPSQREEQLSYVAFNILCELAPAAKTQLKSLIVKHHGRAVDGLLAQLDLVFAQLDAALRLGGPVSNDTAAEDADRLALNQNDILARAGEPLSLSQAALTLGMSRQNLHKRIQTRSALGVMRGSELVVPSIQFTDDAGSPKIMTHLRPLLNVFVDAQDSIWSALQFLVGLDPMLGRAPIEVLKRGNVTAVVQSARAYLGLEGQ